MTAESSDELYEKVWGEEAPHPPAADPSADRIESPAPMVGEIVIAASRDAASQNGSLGATAPPSTPPEPRSTTTLQHQMAETLRRLEARVGDLQQQVQPFTKTTVRESIQAAGGIRRASQGDGRVEGDDRVRPPAHPGAGRHPGPGPPGNGGDRREAKGARASTPFLYLIQEAAG